MKKAMVIFKKWLKNYSKLKKLEDKKVLRDQTREVIWNQLKKYNTLKKPLTSSAF
jgi:hypothetical protein